MKRLLLLVLVPVILLSLYVIILIGDLGAPCGYVSPGGMRICNIASICGCLGISYVPETWQTDTPLSKKCIGICNSCKDFVQCANRDGHEGFVGPIDNLTICDMVYTTEPDVKGECYAYTAVKENKLEICKVIKGNELENETLNDWYRNVTKEECYVNFAKLTKNNSVCYELSLEFEKDRCFKGVAEASGNELLCGEIANTNDKEECIMIVATNLGDVSICEKIEDLGLKDSCYIGVAETSKNASLCEEVTYQAYWKDDCYYNMAEVLKDASLCKKITSRTDWIEGCLESAT
jgi:hypothetical protein